MKKEEVEELEIFLGGTFHQDIDDPDEVLMEYITDSDIESLKELSAIIRTFINSNIDEKEAFIIQNVELYFPAMNLTPLEWIKRVLKVIDEYIGSSF